MNQHRRFATLLFLLPASALAQATGISHPEAVPDQPYTTQEAAPPTYQPQPAPALQPRPRTSADYPPVPYSPTAVTVIATPVASASPAFDPDAHIVTRVEGPANQLPAGTFLKTRIGQSVSTDTTPEGTSFTASLTEPVLREGRVLLPAGSLITGRVTEVHSGKRISGPAAIHLQPQTVTLPDGTRYKLLAQVIDTDLIHSTRVDDEGTIRSHGSSAVQKGAFRPRHRLRSRSRCGRRRPGRRPRRSRHRRRSQHGRLAPRRPARHPARQHRHRLLPPRTAHLRHPRRSPRTPLSPSLLNPDPLIARCSIEASPPFTPV